MPGHRGARAAATAAKVKKRATYDSAFKLHVVKAALQRPHNNRIKPTCSLFPGIEPCQLRKWIRNYEASLPPPPSTKRSGASERKQQRKDASARSASAPTNPSRRSRAVSARLRVITTSVAEDDSGSDSGSFTSPSRSSSTPTSPATLAELAGISDVADASRTPVLGARRLESHTPDKGPTPNDDALGCFRLQAAQMIQRAQAMKRASYLEDDELVLPRPAGRAPYAGQPPCVQQQPSWRATPEADIAIEGWVDEWLNDLQCSAY